MTETVALLSALRQRDVKLWIEHDQLKCSAPAGALDAEMRASLANQKDQLLALLRQSNGIPAAPEEPAPPLLPTISREVGLPVIPARDEQISDFVSALRSCGYDLAKCAARLGVFPRLGVNFWERMRSNWKPQSNDPIDNLITLFIDGHPVRADLLARQISASFVDTAVEMRLVEERGHLLSANLCLFPCFGKYIVTDQAAKNTAINQVMWLWGESFILGGFVDRKVRRRGIDLGTGSGVHAILASDHCSQVVGADVSSRAIAFSNFNAQLNGSKNIDFVLSDLLDSIDGSCDLLIANVPYAPDTAARAGDNFWSGGIDGTDLLRRVVEALPTRLERDGVAHINSLFPNPPGTQIKDHFDAWLGGKLGEWQVLDHTWAVPRYQDLLSDKPYEGDKSAWRFGVVSLRRSGGGNGWWKELAGRGWFFRPDGSCAVVADHELHQEAP
ncbi:methyltransferase [Bradyrhizobium sp. BR 10261]|uniref:TubC N-terminal docking domain-related protein n=1 Tax=Bradyrhizobium sp. BR 10261 TaxID=2749992 RepID=UPI001C648BA5|nr:methyltransferase [Bradyrhizobium sp. BR 10261]MBW7961865.1 methyltransferase [Bradyrhizobium sp. BR 10261]